MQDVHSIDDHRAVGHVLSHGIAELLNRLKGMEVQDFLPGVHIAGGPVSVDTPDSDLSMAAHLHQHLRQYGRLGVIAIDQDGDLLTTVG
jgi:hypothetical protein